MKSDIFSHFSSMSYLPRWCVLLLDLLLSLIAFVVTIAICSSFFDLDLPSTALTHWQQCVVILAVQLAFFWCFHTYSGIIRFSTFIDLVKVFTAVAATGATLLAVNFSVRYGYNVSLFLSSVIVVYCLVAFILLFSLRVGVKTIYDMMMQGKGKQKKVFIYGTQQTGLAIAKMLRSAGVESDYRPVGFIIDGKDEKLAILQGLHVYMLNEKLITIMRTKGVDSVIISPRKMKSLNPAKDLNIFLNNGIHILTMPQFSEWTEGEQEDTKKKIAHIESIKIEDLLERPTIEIDTDNVSEIIRGQVIMVTGAAGSIGQEIVRQVLRFSPQAVILFEQAESPLHDLRLELRQLYPDGRIIAVVGDVRNREKLREVMQEYKPDVVFHAAAYKHVPLMEEYPNEAILANVLGTKNVADLSVEYGVKRFVMISTDKAVNPTNVMGASKRIAEIYVQSLFRHIQTEHKNSTDNKADTMFITTRFGNVLGSNGSVIPWFKKQIAAGGPVTVTHPEITRFFMTIPEACTLVLEAATLGKGGEIFVFDMGTPVKIADLAKNMIRLAGYRPGEDIMINFTGLRPGEKLYEEVLNRKETTLPTSNPKIMIAKVRENDYEQVKRDIDELIETADKHKPMLTVKKMKQIVPEYKSKNSIYEQLD